MQQSLAFLLQLAQILVLSELAKYENEILNMFKASFVPVPALILILSITTSGPVAMLLKLPLLMEDGL